MVLSVTASSADFAAYLASIRELRIELWSRFARFGELTMPRPVPGQHLSDVLRTCCHFSPLQVGQLGQYDSSDVHVIVGSRARPVRNDMGIARP